LQPLELSAPCRDSNVGEREREASHTEVLCVPPNCNPEVKHWTDRWAYFPFTRTPGWSTPVALVYCKLVSMKTNSLTERGLAKLLGIGRDAVGNALEKLISLHKIVVHPVPDEACSFFLIVRDKQEFRRGIGSSRRGFPPR
jgi:hypothetical protein